MLSHLGGNTEQQSYGGYGAYEKPDVSQTAKLAKQYARREEDDDSDDDDESK